MKAYLRLAAVLSTAAICASAQVPQLINYQGRLMQGTNLVNGNVGLSLRLFNVPGGGTLLYEDSNTVTVADGLYSTFIGDNTTAGSLATALTNAAVYVEVAVNGTALTPREQLASVAYALVAGSILPSSTGTVYGQSLDIGSGNTLAGLFNTIAGGQSNYLDSTSGGSSIAGGLGNSINFHSGVSCIGGGTGNGIGDYSGYSFLGGGYQNSITHSTGSFLGGGDYNIIAMYDNYSFLGGGFSNLIQTESSCSVLGGGNGNSIQSFANNSVLGGGNQNIIGPNVTNGVIVGGTGNTIQTNSYESFIGGGNGNSIYSSAADAFLGGGSGNNIGVGGTYATIPGGANNRANGYYSFAAGQQANAAYQGDFVWADSQNAPFTSTANNQFLIRAQGGVGINTASPSQALEVNGNYAMIDGGAAYNGNGVIDAYMGGNGSGSDVQIGSFNGKITNVGFWNKGAGAWMSVACSSITIEGGSDLAEPFALSQEEICPGSVVVIDRHEVGKLKLSSSAYDKCVAGVVSGANGVHPGISMQQTGLLEGGQNIALSGRVYVLADASNGAIEPGDLLTTSATPGHAMKTTDLAKAQGAILGKAMSGLAQGKGMVLVLVTLQ